MRARASTLSLFSQDPLSHFTLEPVSSTQRINYLFLSELLILKPGFHSFNPIGNSGLLSFIMRNIVTDDHCDGL